MITKGLDRWEIAMPNSKHLLLYLGCIITGCMMSFSVQGDEFVIEDGEEVTEQQTLNDNEIGTVQSGATLAVTGMAITAPGNDISLTNNGVISTSGEAAHGIRTGDFSHFEVIKKCIPGYCWTRQDNIVSDGHNARITLNGLIETTGNDAIGIMSVGDNADITASGSINTTGDDAIGIYSSRVNARMRHSGWISTTGDFAHGIASSGDDASINNSGSITTTGTEAHGIVSFNLDRTLANLFQEDGFVYATDNNLWDISDAVPGWRVAPGYGTPALLGRNANIVHSGSIQVTGKDAIGIYSTGANSTITVSGEILATGEAAQAIHGRNNQTLNLLPGFRILGALDLGDATVNITTGGTASSTMTFETYDTINLLGGTTPAVQSGDVVAVIDPTGFAVISASLGITTLGIHTAVNQQLSQESRATAWSQVFARSTQRGDDGAALAYDIQSNNFIGGFEGRLGGHPVGVFAGFSQTNVKTDVTSVNTDTDSFFIGTYGRWMGKRWSLDGALTAGFETHDQQRTVLDNLNGFQTARSNYNSAYISPSLTLTGRFDGLGGIQFQPSARLIYTYGRYDGYSETGATLSNLTVADRNISVANGRLQLAAIRAFDTFDGGRIEVGLRGGLDVRHHWDERIDAAFNGTPLTFDRPGDDTVLGGYVGAHVAASLNERLSLVADVEYGQASGDERSLSANLRFNLRF